MPSRPGGLPPSSPGGLPPIRLEASPPSRPWGLPPIGPAELPIRPGVPSRGREVSARAACRGEREKKREERDEGCGGKKGAVEKGEVSE